MAENISIGEAIIESSKSRPGDKEAVVKLLDKYTEGKFSERRQMMGGAAESILEQMATSKDPAETRELLKLLNNLK